MPDYFWVQMFTAADDRQAARLGREWGGTCAAEYTTRNPIVTPVNGDLRDRIAEVVLVFFGHAQAGRTETSERMAKGIADAALAVRDAELERLRTILAALDCDNDDGAECPHGVEAEQLRGELAAHDYATDVEVARLSKELERRTAQRDAKAEMVRRIRSRHRVHRCKSQCPCEGEGDGRICGYCQMPWPCPDRQDLDRDSADDALDLAKEMHRQRQRADQAEAHRDALIDEVKTLQKDLEEFGEAQKAWVQYRRERDALKAAIELAREEAQRWRDDLKDSRETWAVNVRHVCAMLLAALDAPSGADSPAEPRTPVPPDAEPPHPPHDAQEAAQDAPTTEQIWDYLRRNPQHFRVLISRDMDARPAWWRAHFAKEARIAGATDLLGRDR